MNTHSDQFNFSTPLKLRLVAYFRMHYDLDIKDEEADLFLRSLATVYDALSRDPRLSPVGQEPLQRDCRPEGANRDEGSPGARNTGGTFQNAP